MKKALLLISVIIITAVLCTSCIGPFFVQYAIERHEFDGEFFPQSEKDPSKMTEEEFLAYCRQIKVKKHTEEWIDSQNPEQWSQISYDGLTLNANFFANGDSHKYVIIVHGWTSKKEHMYDYGAYFHDWGYNVLAPDNRAHGSSEGLYIGMGWLDSQDHLGWINKIIERDPEAQITMLGVSMGGATVMMTSGLDLPENVKCLIEDCGYSSVWEEFCSQIGPQFHLPVWPIMDLSEEAAKRMIGYSLKEASSLERLKDAKVPMLFIHGTADTFVPYSMLDKNVAAYGGPYYDVLRVEGASHAESLTKDPELYTTTVKNFVEKFITD